MSPWTKKRLSWGEGVSAVAINGNGKGELWLSLKRKVLEGLNSGFKDNAEGGNIFLRTS